MKRFLWLLTACFLTVMGCTSHKGITPIYPEIGNPNYPKSVDSIQPTFKWEPVKDSEVTYDFIIYECIKTESFSKGTRRAVGREVYYLEGLTEPQCKVERPLEPDTEYYWSVRVRRGQDFSNWSVYDYTLFLGTAGYRATNCPFIFKTPKSEE